MLFHFNIEDPQEQARIEEERPMPRMELFLRRLALIPSTDSIDIDLLLSAERREYRDCPRLHHAYILLRDGIL